MQYTVSKLVGELDQGLGDEVLAPETLATRRIRERVALTGALILTDAFAVAAAFALAYLLRFKTSLGAFYTPPGSPLHFYSTLIFWIVPLVLTIFGVYRLYSLDRLFADVDEYVRVLSATTLSVIVVILTSFLLDERLVISRAWIVISWATIFVTVSTGRFLMRRVVYRLRRAGYLTKRVLVLGGSNDTVALANYLGGVAASGLQVTGVYDPPAVWKEPAGNPPGTAPWLRRLINGTGAEAVIVNAASVPQSMLSQIVRDLADLPTELHIVPGMYEILTTGVQVRDVRGLPLVKMNKVRITGYDRLMKQALDYLVALVVLVACFPLFGVIALAIRLDSPGPIFYRRRVIGQCGRPFDALKFRTMRTDGDALLAQDPALAARLVQEGKLQQDPRVTKVGAVLRRWSLDELPQLLNVLRGQMSLVGPRMITPAELPNFGHWRENLSTVKPGLTGLWQVSGRSTLGYEDRVRLDMHYIRSYSIWSDIAILLSTIPAVISGRGAC